MTAAVAVVVAPGGGCSEERPPSPPPANKQASPPPRTPPVPAPAQLPDPDPTDGPNLDRAFLDRVARQLLAAGGPAPASGGAPADLAAQREVAAARLGLVTELLNNSDEHVLWGAYEAGKGVDPESYQMVELPPLVWTRAYLSCFMLTGPYTMREEGEFGVLEMSVRFRAGLPAGDYPHPLWHSGEEWSSYANAGSIVLAFYHGKSFVAAYRRTPAASAAALMAWDGRWVWQGATGEQPRGARVGQSLSSSNPHVAAVDAAYRTLQPMLAAHRCFDCHAPDNAAGAQTLVLLRYPAQAMAARDALAAVLRENSMPPGNPGKGVPDGIADAAARKAMIDAADAWGLAVTAALEHENTVRGMPPKPRPVGRSVDDQP